MSVYLGSKGAVAYEAGGFQSGLLGVYCVIQRPDMVMEGPFPMREGRTLALGMYFYNYPTNEGMEEGCYLALIFSPQENRRATRRLEFIRRPIADVVINTAGPITTTVVQEPERTVEVVLPATSNTVAVKTIEREGSVTVDIPWSGRTEVDLEGSVRNVVKAQNQDVTFDVEIES